MQIELSKVSKRYRYEWVFRNMNYHFNSQKSYAITGPNGSGKSTLMRLLSGHASPTRGNIQHYQNTTVIRSENLYIHISYAAPYIDLIEEFTLAEHLKFHQKFKAFLPEMGVKEIMSLLAFKKAKNKRLSHFSSGMKQRLKLVLAICSDTALVLLDEPTTNLDRQGIEWYLNLVEQYKKDRIFVVASNVEEDYQFCDEVLQITDYKKKISQ
ncbi:MAG: ABC transporter ATP-binding protein [Bacteroidota bacterium]